MNKAGTTFSFAALVISAALAMAPVTLAQQPPEGFISFSVPRYEKEMGQIRDIYYETYANSYNAPGPSFWDVWLPAPMLSAGRAERSDIDNLWKQTMLHRKIDDKGYVTSAQHFSHAMDDGWPFPLFPQMYENFEGRTFGYLFQDDPSKIVAMLGFWRDDLYKKGYMGERAAARWRISDLSTVGEISDIWRLNVTGPEPSLETEEGFRAEAFLCPYVNFRAEIPSDEPLVGVMEWKREGDKDYHKSRSITFDLQQRSHFSRPQARYCTINPGAHKKWKGNITAIRFRLPSIEGGTYGIEAIFSAYDTRHQMNACNFLIGSIQTFNHTGDKDFLRGNISRMRKVLAYARKELYDRRAKMIRVRYQGHDGLPGFVTTEDGKRKYNYGHSVGGNYWDALPFGNLETYTSYYYVHALRMMADLEEYLKKNPLADDPSGGKPFKPARLRKEADKVVKTINTRMWNSDKGRFFASEDVNGDKWDFGLTFLGTEAITYDAITPEHAREIMDWIDGRRIVEGDTSQGEDIYRWRMAPRATTLRNDSWYYWGWDPDVFPFGLQVQDGGAVFAHSFNDMISRIKVYGPDNAWKRFQEILSWYQETRDEGGYREYYASGEHGNTLQGGGTAGGIGIDMEFLETFLVPYTMIEGFMGFKATPEGFSISPSLPAAWPYLEIENMTFRGQALRIKASSGNLEITGEGDGEEMVASLPVGWTLPQGKDLGGGKWLVTIGSKKVTAMKRSEN